MMRYQKRIAEAFKANEIKSVLIIDDVYDPPKLDEGSSGQLLDWIEKAVEEEKIISGVSQDQLRKAVTEIENDPSFDDSPAFKEVHKNLYTEFLNSQMSSPDPGDNFKTTKGASLEMLFRLERCLSEINSKLNIVKVGVENALSVFQRVEPDVVFLDYYLETSGTPQRAADEKASRDLLGTMLDASKAKTPAIVLMSSAAGPDDAKRYRLKMREQREESKTLRDPLLALRFRYFSKKWVSEEHDKITLNHEATDVLLDIGQGFKFAAHIQRALSEWRQSVDDALVDLLDEIEGLEPKDIAYLLRFRLIDEGQDLSDYLVWLFGENLTSLIVDRLDQKSASFTALRKPNAGDGFEGAYNGPSESVAKLYTRVQFKSSGDLGENDADEIVPPNDLIAAAKLCVYRMGDLYLGPKNDLLVVLNSPCDLMRRKTGKMKAESILTMRGNLKALKAKDATSDNLILYQGKPNKITWMPKQFKTFPVDEKESLGVDGQYKHIGTLNPLYALEAQQLALRDIGRLGNTISPSLAFPVSVNAHVLTEVETPKYVKLNIPLKLPATLISSRGSALNSAPRLILQRDFLHKLVEAFENLDPGTIAPDAQKVRDELINDNKNSAYHDTLLRDGLCLEDYNIRDSLGMLAVAAGAVSTSKDKVTPLQFVVKLSNEQMQEIDISIN